MTRTLSPRCAAVSAAVLPAAPLPATTTSTSSILEHVTVLPSAEEGGPRGGRRAWRAGHRASRDRGRRGRGGFRRGGRLRGPGGRRERRLGAAARPFRRRRRGHAGLAGGSRRAVRGQLVPGQDVVPDQPALPVLLRQRAVRTCTARPQGTQDQGPRHLRRPALRQAGRCRPRRRRPGARPDHRPRADHRSWRPGHRGGVHDPARRARLGPAGAPRAAPLVGQALPVHAESRPDPAPPRGLAGAKLRTAAAGRGGPRRGRRGRRLRREPADDAHARAGRATAFLDRVSVWRFLSPPPALLGGVLVDRGGDRVCDESRYGAALGDAIVQRGGQAWLLTDRATLAEARRQLRGSTLWFQRLQAWYLLTTGQVSAPTVAAVAARAGLDPNRLEATLAAYNAAARDPAVPDPTGKPAAGCSTQRRSSPSAAWSCPQRPARSYAPTAPRSTACTRPAAARPACAPAPTSAACPWPTASSPAAAPATTPRSSRLFPEPRQTDHSRLSQVPPAVSAPSRSRPNARVPTTAT